MKLSKTTLVIPLVGVLLLVGAASVLAAAGATPSSEPVVVAAPSASPSASAETRPLRVGRDDTLLADVLDDLVSKGTITDGQKTAITDALSAARQERIDTAKANAEQLRSFLEDGVITQEEFDQLPDDSRLRQIAGIMDDGQITSDELRGLVRGFGGPGGHGGHGFGGNWGSDKDATPSASPSASPTTSG